jgi:hypothetical protein
LQRVQYHLTVLLALQAQLALKVLPELLDLQERKV